MAVIYLSLGSNIEPEKHIGAGLIALEACFGALVVSRVFESEAVGFEGDNFYNLVVKIESDQSVGAVQQCLHAIEDANGRLRAGQARFSGRTLDIDMLNYGDSVGTIDGVALPRAEILTNAFVLWPLAEIAPDVLHPTLQIPYAELWQAFDKNSQKLWPIAWPLALK